MVVLVAILVKAEGKTVKTVAMWQHAMWPFWAMSHLCMPLWYCWEGCEGDSLVVRKQDTQI